ncbi:MAG TPA: hypothetical protein VEI82_07760, partial [Myxococcota bacterium]|nr:hypothetical protein [Myxococcota bacterium]
MRSSARFLTLVAAAAFGACARPDMHNVLMNEATSHSVEGRWDVAYERMGKVIANDEADPSTAPERLAEDYAILGAWAGMNCRFEDAERHMQRSYDYFVRAKSGNEYI